MLTNELKHYQPTIICLQEVDLEQYEPYFVKLLRSLEYDHILLAAKKKRQGLLVAWKKVTYELVHRRDLHYNLLNAGIVGPTMWTGNVGICLGLKCKDTSNSGIWIANTHLFWHPRGSYERQRQAGILVSETMKLAQKEPKWQVFICGGKGPFGFWINRRFQFHAPEYDLYCINTTADSIDADSRE
jgi:RNA exonuclease NGL2